MFDLSEDAATALFEAAKIASDHAYAPYSHFAVGAAVLLKDGRVITGTNTENASYGLTICAERIALGSAFAYGPENVVAIAVYTSLDSAAPCGACRQFIFEAGPDVVVLFMHNGELVRKPISELLPFAFSRQHLTLNSKNKQ